MRLGKRERLAHSLLRDADRERKARANAVQGVSIRGSLDRLTPVGNGRVSTVGMSNVRYRAFAKGNVR